MSSKSGAEEWARWKNDSRCGCCSSNYQTEYVWWYEVPMTSDGLRKTADVGNIF